VQHITSRQNAIVRRYRDARDRAAVGDPVLLDGAHLVADAIAADLPLRDVVAAEDAVERPELRDLIALLRQAGVAVTTATSAVMAAISPLRSPSVIVALTDPPAAREVTGTSPLVVIAADVQDPGNLGAIVRVAEAAGASGVVAAGRSADPLGWKAVRGSMGSVLRLPVGAAPDSPSAIEGARQHGCRIVATVPRGGRSLFDVDLTRASAIVLGGEGGGLPAAMLDAADERITIPMQEPVESLNVAVTAAVILYEARRQRSQ
jgi:TrmH family RNA methyltransferase